LRNNGRNQNPKPTYLTIRNFTYKDVVKKYHRKEISKFAAERVGCPSGSKEYLAGYSASKAEYINNLPEETIKQYEKEADEWTETGAPEEVKRE
jgi:hypothetical protein